MLSFLVVFGSQKHTMILLAAKLPVRWLALEAIETGIFSELTDVWAFGVLVWEVLRYMQHTAKYNANLGS